MRSASRTNKLPTTQGRELAALLRPPPGPPARPPWPSVFPAGRAAVWRGGGDFQVTLVDPILVVEVLDDTACEYGRWRPEGVSGKVIPGHEEVT